jgi:hypothetical protein
MLITVRVRTNPPEDQRYGDDIFNLEFATDDPAHAFRAISDLYDALDADRESSSPKNFLGYIDFTEGPCKVAFESTEHGEMAVVETPDSTTIHFDAKDVDLNGVTFKNVKGATLYYNSGDE